MVSAINPSMPVTGSPTTPSVRANFQYAHDEISALQVGAVTATGSTTSRTVADRFAAVVNVKDFGAVGDGITNDWPAIKTAVALGGAIYFPKGRYYISGPYCVLGPNTRIYGDGPGQSVIVPGDMRGGFRDPNFGYIFVSRNYDANGAFNNTPTTPALQTDINITIESIGFDLTNISAAAPLQGGICRFLWAANVRIRNISGDNHRPNTDQGWVGFAFLGCDNYSVDGFYGRNVINGIDQWQGCSRAKHNNLWFEQTTQGGNGGVVNWQGVGTGGFYGIGYDLQISNSTFWSNGGVTLFLDSFAAGSVTTNMLLTNLVISQRSGTSGYGIVCRGLVDTLVARGIVINAMQGADLYPILVGGYFDPTAPLTGTNIVATTSGTASVTVNYTCICSVGNYLYISNGAGGPVTGNGVSLNGYYPITAVGTGTITVLTPTPATASGPLAGTTQVRGYYGTARNVTLSDITIDGCSNATLGGALITANGQGHIIDNIVVTPNYQGASTPGYNTIVSLDTTQAHEVASPFPCYVGAIVGAPGTGALPAGFVGDSRIIWNNAGLPPASLPARTQPAGTQDTSVATTAFASSLIGVSAVAIPDADTTLTAAQAGARFINITGSLTAQRKITLPVAGAIRNWVVRNGTTQSLGVVGSTGATSWIPTLGSMEFWTDGANILQGTNTTFATWRVGDINHNSLIITSNATPSQPITLAASNTGGIQFTSNVGFNSTTPIAKPTASGAWAGNTAGKALSTALAALGLITDTSTA